MYHPVNVHLNFAPGAGPSAGRSNMTNHLKTAALFLLIALLAGPALAAAEKPLLA